MILLLICFSSEKAKLIVHISYITAIIKIVHIKYSLVLLKLNSVGKKILEIEW